MVDEKKKKKPGNPNLKKGSPYNNLNPNGQPKKEINWDRLARMCEDHATEAEISRWLGISEDTITRACQREYGMTFGEFYAQHKTGGKISLRRSMHKSAEGIEPTLLRDKAGRIIRDGKGNPVFTPGAPPNVVAQIFLAKNELGYSDKQDIVVGPITLHVVEG